MLPTEEEQNKINKLIEDSEYLETEKLNLEKIFKRAEKMEYAAKDRESKAEETAEQQREASARCQIELLSATSKYVEMNDVVDRTCTSSTTAEKHMEKITRQLNEHKEQFKTILKSHTSASTECDQVKSKIKQMEREHRVMWDVVSIFITSSLFQLVILVIASYLLYSKTHPNKSFF